ncbi:hypothetical protein CYMTET_49116 [Cymbomonas tetramitiformis]|uniref:CS domain-containing protein n=1 Tax=Cymbomonas tetramitiformis TaxID=36881 RepID=A0AAE0EV17_9CHLO|nr:hypothetical protein CYMTET_49116 [Cymbomonas tetramitiformis]
MNTDSSRHPSVTWAQRKDKLYLTIHVSDCSKPNFKIDEEGDLYFEGIGGSEKALYSLNISLLYPVKNREAKVAITPRYLFLIIPKTESGPHWERLLRAPGRPPNYIKIDWDKWKDEDEEEAEANVKEFNVGELDDIHKYDEFADEELDSEGENDDAEPMED